MTIIKPQYTSEKLNQIRNDAIDAMGEKSYYRTRTVNTICNVIMAVLACVTCVAAFSFTFRQVFVDHNFTLLFWIAFVLEAPLLPISTFCISQTSKGWTNPVLGPILRKMGSKWTSVCENFFLNVIIEAEQIEKFCKLLEEHPNCIIHRDDYGGIIMEYVNDNFAVRKSFRPEEKFTTYTSSLGRDNKLDFSYLDAEANIYIDTEEEEEVCDA